MRRDVLVSLAPFLNLPVPFSAGIIYKTFQGDLRIETQQYVVKPESRNKRPEFDVDRGEIRLGHFSFNSAYASRTDHLAYFARQR